MKKGIKKITLDQPVSYQIKVPGALDKTWADWVGDMSLVIESEEAGSPVTILTGKLDQAALQGLLRRLYSLGLPLISANYIDEEL